MNLNNIIPVDSILFFVRNFNNWAFIIAGISMGLTICLAITSIILRNKKFKNKKWIIGLFYFLVLIDVVFFMLWFIGISGW